MNKKYISRNYRSTAYAGNKAKTDIEQIMSDMGFENAGLKQRRISGLVSGYFATLASMLSAPFKLSKGDMLLLQYPLKKYFSLECRLAHLRGAKVVALIHDLGAFRRKKLTVKQEIRRLSNADYIIAHSPEMRQWLLDHGLKRPVGVLGIFDYLSDCRPSDGDTSAPGTERPFEVVYVGALRYKNNAFIYRMGRGAKRWRTILHGTGFDDSLAASDSNAECRGYIESDSMIANPHGDFGLIWYGDSEKTCAGEIGKYVRYIAPHKLSMYMRCHLPAIIWSGSAMAGFVRENGVGIVVDSLDELDEIFAKMTPDEYARMKRNTIDVSNRLASGFYTRRAIAEAEKCLEQLS